MSRAFLVVCIAALAGACLLPAEADGFYCVGNDYFAYQSRDTSPKGISSHRVVVIRFDSKGKLKSLKPASLPDVEAQGIRCGIGSVEVASLDSVYTVPIEAKRLGAVGVAALQENWQSVWPDSLHRLGEHKQGEKGYGAVELARVGEKKRIVLGWRIQFTFKPCGAVQQRQLISYDGKTKVDSISVYSAPLEVTCSKHTP